ncbi:MAG: LacI family transcriptional regulator [Kiritimatiellae bacterium]|nr:LacI family transcriptional regulator [Kiritimatiellia bacterium]MDW8459381.1 LacI family DNA-binding transcriptional regulator [Verrucomicrobiota bacterium]
MRVTQKDIARRLGVSTSLVSRVLSGTAESIGANPGTIARIRKEAEALGYAPSAAARQLRGRGPGLIGVVAADLEDPFFGPLAAEVARQAHAAGFALTLVGVDRRVPDPSDIHALLQYHLEGLLILGGGPNAWVAPFLERRIRVVRIGVGEGAPHIAQVAVDEIAGFAALIDHLIDKGHRDFAFVGADVPSHRRRRNLVRALLRKRRLALPASRAVLPDSDVLEAGARGGEKLVRANSDQWPTAIICSSDAVALGVLRSVASVGWRVPDHVSVTGFDDLALARLSNPPLTSARQPIDNMVADALRMVREGAPTGVSRLHAPILVVRGSTDFACRTT